MNWYLNRSLTNFRSEVTARWPKRDKTSDGTIGDYDHSKTSSDHNPDPDGSVDAWDMDVDGVDVKACLRAFEAHESSKYWIYNDQICFRSEGWKPRSYAYVGPNRNRHTKHVHFNTRESHEHSTKPWFKEELDMPLSNDDVKRVANAVWDAGFGRTNPETAGQRLGDLDLAVPRIEAQLADLKALYASTPPGAVTIPDDQLERVLRKVLGSVADPGAI